MFGVDLEAVGNTRSWRWFTTRLSYLMSIDGLLRKTLNPQPDEPGMPTFGTESDEE